MQESQCRDLIPRPLSKSLTIRQDKNPLTEPCNTTGWLLLLHLHPLSMARRPGKNQSLEVPRSLFKQPQGSHQVPLRMAAARCTNLQSTIKMSAWLSPLASARAKLKPTLAEMGQPRIAYFRILSQRAKGKARWKLVQIRGLLLEFYNSIHG